MNHETALCEAITLTDEILALLDQGEFDRVGELGDHRKVLIEQAFVSSIEEIDLIKARHLQNLNQQVVDKLNLFKQSVMDRQGQIRNASNAVRAYRSNDSDPINSTLVRLKNTM
jgi:hypothetical protein